MVSRTLKSRRVMVFRLQKLLKVTTFRLPESHCVVVLRLQKAAHIVTSRPQRELVRHCHFPTFNVADSSLDRSTKVQKVPSRAYGLPRSRFAAARPVAVIERICLEKPSGFFPRGISSSIFLPLAWFWNPEIARFKGGLLLKVVQNPCWQPGKSWPPGKQAKQSKQAKQAKQGWSPT